ncbi:MAG: hypothetical protein ACOCR0_00995 [Haloferacaceae archaeon]
MFQVTEAFQDPVFVLLLIAILVFAIFMYLLARRTLLSMREGYQQGRRDR